MQTILGAGGTIGKDLAKELRQYTDKIRLVSRTPQKVNEGDELLKADLRDPSTIDSAVRGSSVVYLVVGFEYKLSDWQKYWPPLMKATIDACLKYNATLVFFDNVYLYDKKAVSQLREDSPVNPPTKKGKVRAEIVQMLWEAVKTRGLKAVVARSADFYGPKNEKSFLIELVYKNHKKGKKANWFIDAKKKHSFTYTPDAAGATALLGNTPSALNQTWHLPNDSRAWTGEEWANRFAKETGAKPGISTMPMWLLRVLGLFMPFMREMPEMMYQYDRDYFFDSSKFMKAFDFKITPYETGIRETVAAG
jgi:nucleoside-diphosphate-sugar epimerase